MGHKTNPIALRLQASTRRFDQAWYSDHYYSELIGLDLAINRYLQRVFHMLKLPSSRCAIQYLPHTTQIYTFFCYPKASRIKASRMYTIPVGLPISKKRKFHRNKKRTVRTILRTPSRSFRTLLFGEQAAFCPKPLLNEYRTIGVQDPTQNKTPFNNLSYVTQMILPERGRVNPYPIEQLDLFYSWYDRREVLRGVTRAIFPEGNTFLAHKPPRIPSSQTVSTLKRLLLKRMVVENPGLYGASRSLLDAPLALHDRTPKVPLESPRPTYQKYRYYPENSIKGHRYISHLENTLRRGIGANVSLIPFRVSHPWQDAGFFAEEIVRLLERRIPFRLIKRRILWTLQTEHLIQGVRITCAGRVGGKSKKAQRAKMDTVNYGQTSLHVFSAKIDFAARTAHTALGAIGIKVWICYR